MKKMKNLFVIGLICFALGACSTGYQGGYKGSARIDTFHDSTAGASKQILHEDVFALFKHEGSGGTIEFSDTNAIKNCKLKFDSLVARPKFDKGQTCEIRFEGTLERFTIDTIILDLPTKDAPSLIITVDGTNSGSHTYGRHYTRILFNGKL